MSIQHSYTYGGALKDSEKVNWRVDELIGGDKKLDFRRPFLPESLARTADLEFLSGDEQLILNQIRGATYLHLFGLVEEFILPFAVERARDGVHGDKHRVRALLTFADEEAKHQLLFQRFAEEFAKGFSVPLQLIGPARGIADAVLAHSPLAVSILILHLEWLTQRHYLEGVKTDEDLDPQFVSLLRHHWLEEAQHVKVDTLVTAELAESATNHEIETAIEEFLEIAALLEGGLQQQVQFDLDTLERAVGRRLTEPQRAQFLTVQLPSYRWTFLVSGLEQANFVNAIGDLSAVGLARVREVAHSLGLPSVASVASG